MFETSSQILRAREGTLSETPFSLLLHRLWVEQRTVTLELRKNQLDKRIAFEDGWPVGCHSNLLHETLGRFLVERGRITDAQCLEALADAAREEMPLGEMIVRKGWLQPYDLYRAMQQNMARRILDCFTWTDAKWRLGGPPDEPETPLKMNPAQLILTASTTVMPFDVVAQALTFFDGQRFALVPEPPHDPKQLRLHTRDRKLLELLRRRPSFEEICASGLSAEEAMRRLYAFGVLGMAAFAEAVAEGTERDSSPALPLVPAPTNAAPERPESTTRPFGPEAEKRANEVMDAFLKHRAQDPFELLGLKDASTLPEIRKAYLAHAERFFPGLYSGDVADKAEELFLAGARAYAQLADYESRNVAIERRRKRREEQSRRRGEAGADFRIRTNLLDAGEQFREGLKLLEQGEWSGAINYLEFACDCDPGKASYRAHLGWARYRFQPAAPERALKELAQAVRTDPRCHEALFFEGCIRREQGDLAGAEDFFRRAIKANPEERTYTDALKDVTLARRRA